MSELFTWLGIALCLGQAAVFSGLNLAVFSLSRLRLEAAAESGDRGAQSVLALRQDANFTLTTILLGNVAINVLLTLLADSVLTGFSAFLFSTVVITFGGEIIPQAYFSRHALSVAVRFVPMLRFYRVILWPVAWPSSKLLDAWVGPEGTPWLREHEIIQILEQHARGGGTEISHVEAVGAINFLALDDLPVGQEGELLDPQSVIRLVFRNGRPVFPEITRSVEDPFLQRIAVCDKKWVVLVDEADEPRLVVSAAALLRAALFDHAPFDPVQLCHRPLVVRDPHLPLGQTLTRLIVRPERPGDDVIDEDLILVWEKERRRIITGSDLLGWLLRRIALQAPEFHPSNRID